MQSRVVPRLNEGHGGVALNHGEQVIEVMGDAPRETSHGLHLLRLEQLVLELFSARDVLDGSQNGRRFSLGPAGQLGAGVDVPHLAVRGSTDHDLEVIGASPRDEVHQRLIENEAILVQRHVLHLSHWQPWVARDGEPVNSASLIRAPKGARREVELPTPDLGDGLGSA